MSTKTCPSCQKELGRSARACECGQTFGKAAAASPKKPRKTAGKRPKRPAARQPASPPAADPVRCCLFNDGAVGIVAAHGALELNPEDAQVLAGFVLQHFQP